MFLDKAGLAQHLGEFAGLFERAFERKANPDALRWRFIDCPDSDTLHVNVAWDGERMIANCASSPFRLATPRGPAQGVLLLTAMTDPAHAGQGHYPRLGEELVQRAQQHSVALAMAFLTRSTPLLLFTSKMGYRDVYEIPMYSVQVAALRTGAASAAAASRDDGFAVALREPRWLQSLLRMDRSPDRMTWRYVDNPLAEYSRWILPDDDGAAHSHAVAKRYGETLDLVDFVPRDGDAAAELLAVIGAHARDNGIARLNVWAPPHVPHRSAVIRAGFAPTAPVTCFVLRVLAGLPGAPDGDASAYDYSRWFLQMGDSDVY